MRASWTATEGEIVGGRYRLLSKIGRGAMGTVFRAEHTSLGSKAAVKVIDPELLQKSGTEEVAELEHRFLREARAAASLDSAHVVRVLDYGIERGSPYIAMELLEGELLADFMSRTGAIEPARTFRILGDVAKAIARGHDAGIIHRDLKPENIFLARVDDEIVAKVLDFGIAKMLARSSAGQVHRTTLKGGLIGTPCYMSPEQITEKPLDAQADIWAIAVIAFECLTGRLPFEANTVGGLAVQICGPKRPRASDKGPVPPGFDAWWARASSLEPQDRFRDMREAIDGLRLALDPTASARKSLSSGSSLEQLAAPVIVNATRADVTPAPLRSTQATMSASPRPRVKSSLLGAGILLTLAAAGTVTWFATRPVRSAETSSVAASPAPSDPRAGDANTNKIEVPRSGSPITSATASTSASATVVADAASAAPSASAVPSGGPVPSGRAPYLRPPPGSVHPQTDPRLGL